MTVATTHTRTHTAETPALAATTLQRHLVQPTLRKRVETPRGKHVLPRGTQQRVAGTVALEVGGGGTAGRQRSLAGNVLFLGLENAGEKALVYVLSVVGRGVAEVAALLPREGDLGRELSAGSGFGDHHVFIAGLDARRLWETSRSRGGTILLGWRGKKGRHRFRLLKDAFSPLLQLVVGHHVASEERVRQQLRSGYEGVEEFREGGELVCDQIETLRERVVGDVHILFLQFVVQI